MRAHPRHGLSVAVVCSLALSALAIAQQSSSTSDMSAADLYENACAACHAASGRGRPQHEVGFAVPLPDFTDCNFATREPDEDWLAIVHSAKR